MHMSTDATADKTRQADQAPSVGRTGCGCCCAYWSGDSMGVILHTSKLGQRACTLLLLLP
jgi:hypothetical protein